MILLGPGRVLWYPSLNREGGGGGGGGGAQYMVMFGSHSYPSVNEPEAILHVLRAPRHIPAHLGANP